MATGPQRNRRRRSAARWRRLLVEQFEPRLLLSYTVLENTPLVYGSKGMAGGTISPAPQHGTATTTAAGGFIYTPATDYVGIDNFQVKVSGGAYMISLFVVPPLGGQTDTNRQVPVISENYYGYPTYVLSTADIGFVEPSIPAASITGVSIDTFDSLASITDRFVTIRSGQVLPIAEVVGGYVQIMPPASQYSSTHQTPVTFRVQFDPGGGQSPVLSNVTKTLTLNRTDVNQQPSATGFTARTPQDTPYKFATSDFGFSDPHNNPPNVLLAVKIGGLSSGTLTDAGVAVPSGTLVPVADIAANKLVF